MLLAASELNALARLMSVPVRDKSSQRTHSPKSSRVRSFRIKLMARSRLSLIPYLSITFWSSTGRLSKVQFVKSEAAVVLANPGLDK